MGPRAREYFAISIDPVHIVLLPVSNVLPASHLEDTLPYSAAKANLMLWELCLHISVLPRQRLVRAPGASLKNGC